MEPFLGLPDIAQGDVVKRAALGWLAHGPPDLAVPSLPQPVDELRAVVFDILRKRDDAQGDCPAHLGLPTARIPPQM